MFAFLLVACTSSFTSSFDANRSVEDMSAVEWCEWEREANEYAAEAIPTDIGCYFTGQLAGEQAAETGGDYATACQEAYDACDPGPAEPWPTCTDDWAPTYTSCDATIADVDACATENLRELRRVAELGCEPPADGDAYERPDACVRLGDMGCE